ncbi:MAG: hypothetical protein MJ188_00360 [Treponema sp.]|nr:hypothetical protein [Treponema sp.]
MKKEVNGLFCELMGKKYYKIENYDYMDNFFMTITSSSDIWNFCWSKGGITAGRIDSNHAIFPYYTADKVADASAYTGNYTSIAVKTDDGIVYWEPFATLHSVPSIQKQTEKYLCRNIYKNENGTEVLFEEINTKLGLSFITGWTSSEKFGVVRSSKIINISDKKIEFSILDGCQNILPACCTSDFQNNNSILLDAYKKTDLQEDNQLALFSVSSIVTDKATPNEGLFANTCWFTTSDKIILATDAPTQFVETDELPNYNSFETSNCTKGERSSCFICRNLVLSPKDSDNWYQVFDTNLSASGIAKLNNQIKNRDNALKALEDDIELCDRQMTEFLKAADGIEDTAEEITCLHHRQNVMFNIMRGGLILNNGKIEVSDFAAFVKQRNKALAEQISEELKTLTEKEVTYDELKAFVESKNNPQYMRLFLEYLPLTFSRRHGDPSRPWNAFNIKIKNNDGNPILNYEGNWRDIFQNWEALAYSFPQYIKNMCGKFLNAMTADGFNPYKINRAGIDWEIPDPDNPWAQIGYWGDHQIIYFDKLLEFYNKTNRAELLNSLNEKIYTSANVPYRLNSYKKIVENPRNTIIFDKELSQKLMSASAEKGSDEKLIQNSENSPYLITFAAKALQIVLTKVSNLVPGGGIWLNTQRPEWNDANNALAGYGLSVVTLCYLCRYINVLLNIFEASLSTGSEAEKSLLLPKCEIELLQTLAKIYAETDPKTAGTNPEARKIFTDKIGLAFEKERNELYANGYNGGESSISTKAVIQALLEFKKHVEYSILMNKREDGLFHSYNTLKICGKNGEKMEIVYLQEMLEGQVAVLSSGLLSVQEAKDLIIALQNSKMYEPKQNSFMLYPNKELPAFYNKNCISAQDIKGLENLLEKTGSLYLQKDTNGIYHFNGDFRNSMAIKEFIEKQDEKPTAQEEQLLLDLYEKTFNHQAFTGRSGTFYAYEGLGSIYWHMVSKLLLAVQENTFKAYEEDNAKLTVELEKLYYDVRSGLSYNKKPEVYGAFPAEPYSHTPYHKGAKQPGMTGQVKEEVLTRWGELGLFITDGTVSFNPIILKKSEIKEDKTLNFTWCGVPVTYKFTDNKETYITVEGIKNQESFKETHKGSSLNQQITADLFARNGKITAIQVEFSSGFGK